jgi:drug/metabolite transporter (DMT)-like permease
MVSRKPVNAQAAGLMIVLSMIWGLQQVVLKAAAVDITPILQVSLRSGFAVILRIVLLFRGEQQSFSRETWLPGILAGVLFSLQYMSVGEGLRYTTASHSVVFSIQLRFLRPSVSTGNYATLHPAYDRMFAIQYKTKMDENEKIQNS